MRLRDRHQPSGRETTVNIIKVGGEEEEIKMKLYRVSLSGAGDTKKYVLKAVGFHASVNRLKEYMSVHLQSCSACQNKTIRRGKGDVDLLIGFDHAQNEIKEYKGPDKRD